MTDRKILEFVDGKRGIKYDEVKSMKRRETGFNRSSVDIDMLDGRLLEWDRNSDREASDIIAHFREYQETQSQQKS